MAPQDSANDLDLAQEVLRYFKRNPEAADTLEGVARWRLLDQRIYSTVEQVTRALALLVSRGLVVKEPVGRSGTIFRLNKKALPKIKSFLEEKPRSGAKRPKK